MNANRRSTVKERARLGKSLRKKAPRSGHAKWSPAPGRPDPISLLEEQNKDRLDWLVPVRHGRMMASPFAFFRGGARIMAADLSVTPVSGLKVQACGDAHLANFGLYASPERELVFDVNDFDETLEGPWEWDIKRLAVSFAIAARHNGLGRKDSNQVTGQVVRSYREAMNEFAEWRTMDIWYAVSDEKQFRGFAHSVGQKKQAARLAEKTTRKDSLQALDKLAEEVDGEYRIKSQPPLLVPLRDLTERLDYASEETLIRGAFEEYAETLLPERKVLLDRFHPVDMALKVVGVGSVGTRCWILLLEGRDRGDPLFLQMKEATYSVLAEHLGPSRFKNHGRRVVEGQRLMQTVSDIFLGWTRHPGEGRDYYWRQLRDWKGSVNIDGLDDEGLFGYAQACGWTLARAHARSGDPIAIAAYLGSSETFDRALIEFADRYADQNQLYYENFLEAIRSGRLEADSETA